jgi:hypothetical protein
MTVCILLVDYCRSTRKYSLLCSSQPLYTQSAVRKSNISQFLQWQLHFRSTKIKKILHFNATTWTLIDVLRAQRAAPGLHGPSHIPFYRNWKQNAVNTIDSAEHLFFSQYKFLNILLNIFKRRRASKWSVRHYRESQAMLLKTSRNTASSPCLSCQHHNT